MCITPRRADIASKGCDVVYVKYICQYCGKEFLKRIDCELHELVQHKDFRPDVGEIVADKKWPCDFCGNAYYVYGCEFACQKLKDCGTKNKYKHFVKDVN